MIHKLLNYFNGDDFKLSVRIYKYYFTHHIKYRKDAHNLSIILF